MHSRKKNNRRKKRGCKIFPSDGGIDCKFELHIILHKSTYKRCHQSWFLYVQTAWTFGNVLLMFFQWCTTRSRYCLFAAFSWINRRRWMKSSEKNTSRACQKLATSWEKILLNLPYIFCFFHSIVSLVAKHFFVGLSSFVLWWIEFDTTVTIRHDLYAKALWQ